MTNHASKSLAEHRQRVALGILYLGFTATGFACALPGVLLPMLQGAWGWNDRQGGLWFLLIACGSAAGPLVVGHRSQRAVAAGFLFASLAAALWCLHSTLAQLSGALWGLGLGMAMTGISLLSQDLMPDRAAGLVRLNFLWALGAFGCPLLLGPLLSVVSFRAVLWIAAALLASLSLATLLAVPAPRSSESKAERGTQAWKLAYWAPRGIPLSLLAATAMSTGIEASAGAWLATYADRSAHMLDITVAAPGCLWAGLLCSRSLGWLAPRVMDREGWIRGLLVMVAVATLGLLLPFHKTFLLGSSFLLGFGLGPLYPALLVRVLALRKTSLVFFAAGLASAVMPWATGVLSTRTGLLRVGLLVPALAAICLLLSAWQALAARESRTPSAQPS